MKLKVHDHPGLYRDSSSKAIINNDESSYNEYKSKKILQSKLIQMSNDIEYLKKTVEELKLLVTSK